MGNSTAPPWLYQNKTLNWFRLCGRKSNQASPTGGCERQAVSWWIVSFYIYFKASSLNMPAQRYTKDNMYRWNSVMELRSPSFLSFSLLLATHTHKHFVVYLTQKQGRWRTLAKCSQCPCTSWHRREKKRHFSFHLFFPEAFIFLYEAVCWRQSNKMLRQ